MIGWFKDRRELLARIESLQLDVEIARCGERLAMSETVMAKARAEKLEQLLAAVVCGSSGRVAVSKSMLDKKLSLTRVAYPSGGVYLKAEEIE